MSFSTYNRGAALVTSSLKTGESVYILAVTGDLSTSNALDGNIDQVAITQSVYSGDINAFAYTVQANIEASASVKKCTFVGYNQAQKQLRWQIISNYQNQLTLDSFAISGGTTSPIVTIQYWGGISEVPLPLSDTNQLLDYRELAVSVTGTAQAGGASSITLASGASAVDGEYVGLSIKLTSGTGSGQTNIITAYNGTTKVATVQTAWATPPDNTSAYAIAYTQKGWALAGSLDTDPVWNIQAVDTNISGQTRTIYPSGGQGFDYIWADGFFSSPITLYAQSQYIPQ